MNGSGDGARHTGQPVRLLIVNDGLSLDLNQIAADQTGNHDEAIGKICRFRFSWLPCHNDRLLQTNSHK